MLAIGSSGTAMILQAAGRMSSLSWFPPKASGRGTLSLLWGGKKKKLNHHTLLDSLLVCSMCFWYLTYGFIMRLTFSLRSVFLLPGTCFMPLCHLDPWELKSFWPGLCSVLVKTLRAEVGLFHQKSQNKCSYGRGKLLLCWAVTVVSSW